MSTPAVRRAFRVLCLLHEDACEGCSDTAAAAAAGIIAEHLGLPATESWRWRFGAGKMERRAERERMLAEPNEFPPTDSIYGSGP